MYFSTIVTFAALPFLVGAVPVSPKSSRTDRLISIPLSRRSILSKDGESIDLGKLKASRHHATARSERALSPDEGNTGESLAFKRGHSNERRDVADLLLTVEPSRVVWTGQVVIGSPPQSFNMIFDTFTTDIIVDGATCGSTCSGKSLYDIAGSTTGKNLGEQAEAIFGGGSANGNLVSEVVTVAGNTVSDQNITVATSISPTLAFPNNTGDGVMGMGLDNGNGSFFGSVIRSGGLFSGSRSPAPVFAFHMTQTGGELIIGGTDPSKFEGNLSFVDVDKSGFWGVQMDSMSVNGNVSVTNTGAILSTANPFITSNKETIAKIYSNIPDSRPLEEPGLWSVPCNSNVTVAITLGGVEFNTTSQYVFNPVLVKDHCLGAFATRINDTSPTMHLGNCFLRNVYAEFDQLNMRVGFAKATA